MKADGAAVSDEPVEVTRQECERALMGLDFKLSMNRRQRRKAGIKETVREMRELRGFIVAELEAKPPPPMQPELPTAYPEDAPANDLAEAIERSVG